MMKRIGLPLMRAFMLGCAMVVLAACSQNGGSDAAEGTAEFPKANPASGELFEHSYGYLIKGDPDFTRLAPNYSTLRPFNPDTAVVVQTHSEIEGLETPPDGYKESLHIRVNRPMNVRIIIADSTGAGKIAYEFEELPEGEYTAGSKGWPLPQVEQTEGNGWVYVYVVGGNRFRWRGRFALDEQQNLIPLVTESTAG